MQCLSELIPPTAVTHSLSLSFLSPSANNLIIARSSLLQIFAFKSVPTSSLSQNYGGPVLQINGHSSPASKPPLNTTRLVLIGEYRVPGKVTALARVRGQKSKSGADLLLISFERAKLSFVEWNAEQHTISPISLHYYERDDLREAPWNTESMPYPTILAVDPSNRCAAFKFGRRKLAIIPFRRQDADLAIDDLDGAALTRSKSLTNGGPNVPAGVPETPFTNSFVLSLMTIDPTLINPIHFAFLHEYREPTLAILSSRKAPASGLRRDQRDVVSYTAYTLDLEEQARTPLISLNGLPNDLRFLIPLPRPVGGVLLVGDNELIHVDQQGRAFGIAVNETASISSAFSLQSKSALSLRLEGCTIEPLGSGMGDMLVVLKTGESYVLTFKLDGQSVSNMDLHKVSLPTGHNLVNTGISCASLVGRGRLFLGSSQSESVILGWQPKTQVGSDAEGKEQLNGSGQDVEAEEEEFDIENDDLDDDLYASSEAKPTKGGTRASNTNALPPPEYYEFHIHDTLLSLAPLNDMRLVARPSADKSATAETALLISTGQGSSSRIREITRSLPVNNTEISKVGVASKAWTFEITAKPDSGSTAKRMLFTTESDEDENSLTAVYELDGLTASKATLGDFDPKDGAAIEMAVLNGGNRFARLLAYDLRVYDTDFNLSQILPLTEDETTGPIAISMMVAEPFIAVQRSDQSIVILKIDDAGELEEMALGPGLKDNKWVACCLYDDANDVFRLESKADVEDPSTVLLFAIGENGNLEVFHLPDSSSSVYSAPGFTYLPPFLTSDFNIRRPNARTDIHEILVAELGDRSARGTYLLARAADEQITLYQPYQHQAANSSAANLRFAKVPAEYCPLYKPEEEYDPDAVIKAGIRRMFTISDLNGLSAVSISGATPCLILKSSTSMPKIVPLDLPELLSITTLDISDEQKSLITVDAGGYVRKVVLPKQFSFDLGLTVRDICSGQTLGLFDIHPPSSTIAAVKTQMSTFKLPIDELHPEWDAETTVFLPQVETDSLQLIDWTTTQVESGYQFELGEVVNCVKTLDLVYSEVSLRRKQLIVVGTAVVKGEEISIMGRLYAFDVVDTVPEDPSGKATRKLRLLAKEELKGAVTSVSSIGNEGFMLVSYGQKVMVRGLKEDGTILPTAFMDVQCYTSSVKELEGTGMAIVVDAVKGVWLIGYKEDPYELRLFSKSWHDRGAITAEFLPVGDSLFIVIHAEDGQLEVLKFDPHNPKSLSGQRLLPVSNITTNAPLIHSDLLPRRSTMREHFQQTSLSRMSLDSDASPSHQVLFGSIDGGIYLLTALDALAYRSLSALQTFLQTVLPHEMGLNTKALRNVDADLTIGGRAILDGDVLRRWHELGSWRRQESCNRAGVDYEWEIVMLLEGIMGAGLPIS